MRVASAQLTDLGEPPAFEEVAVDPTVLDGNAFGGADFLALEAEDGQLHLVTPDHQLTSTYGPDVRVWLTALAGDGVLVRAQGADGLDSDFYLMNAAGEFTLLMKNVMAATGDGPSLVWLERGAEGSDLRIAAPSADGFDLAGAELVPVRRGDASVNVRAEISSARELRATDGRVAILGSVGASFSEGVAVLDGDGFIVTEIALSPWSGGPSPLRVLQDSHVWIGIGYPDAGAFPTLQRLEY